MSNKSDESYVEKHDSGTPFTQHQQHGQQQHLHGQQQHGQQQHGQQHLHGQQQHLHGQQQHDQQQQQQPPQQESQQYAQDESNLRYNDSMNNEEFKEIDEEMEFEDEESAEAALEDHDFVQEIKDYPDELPKTPTIQTFDDKKTGYVSPTVRQNVPNYNTAFTYQMGSGQQLPPYGSAVPLPITSTPIQQFVPNSDQLHAMVKNLLDDMMKTRKPVQPQLPPEPAASEASSTLSKHTDGHKKCKCDGKSYKNKYHREQERSRALEDQLRDREVKIAGLTKSLAEKVKEVTDLKRKIQSIRDQIKDLYEHACNPGPSVTITDSSLAIHPATDISNTGTDKHADVKVKTPGSLKKPYVIPKLSQKVETVTKATPKQTTPKARTSTRVYHDDNDDEVLSIASSSSRDRSIKSKRRAPEYEVFELEDAYESDSINTEAMKQTPSSKYKGLNLKMSNNFYSCAALKVDEDTLIDIYREAMVKKNGRYQQMIELLAQKIIGDSTLIHCTPAAVARDSSDLRVPIPVAIRRKISTMISQFKDIGEKKDPNDFNQALRYYITNLRKKANNPRTTEEIAMEVKQKLQKLEKKIR